MRNLLGWLETRLAQITFNYLNIAEVIFTGSPSGSSGAGGVPARAAALQSSSWRNKIEIIYRNKVE